MSKPRFLIVMIVIAIWLSTTAFQALPQPASPSVSPAPGPFGKIGPVDKANDISIIETLSWTESTGGTTAVDHYEYCIDTTADSKCTPVPTDPVQNWTPVGLNTHIDLPELLPDTTYYWQVRALDNQNPAHVYYADTGTLGGFWAFTTSAVPNAFAKAKPNNGSLNLQTPFNLTWGNSEGATYEYCLDTTDDNVCAGNHWVSAGTNMTVSLVKGDVLPGTTYFWQVRARNLGGTTEANAGTWWSFSTFAAPGSFAKTSPAIGDVTSNSPTLKWGASSNLTGYQYCYDSTVNNKCDGGWQDAGTTQVDLSSLLYNKTYEWQVRAVNTTGDTYANDGAWWTFKTISDVPGDFAKNSPVDSATGVPLTQTLSWSTSANATSYEYCIDEIQDTTCQGTWKTTTLTTAAPTLQYSKAYYWQVRAVNNNPASPKYADSSAWFKFTTQDAPPPPNAFSKTLPANDTQNVATYLVLTWQSTNGATKYEYCFDKTDDDTCAGDWLKPDSNTKTFVYGLDASTTYYWQVRAVNDNGATEANGGEWWSFKTSKYGFTLFLNQLKKNN